MSEQVAAVTFYHPRLVAYAIIIEDMRAGRCATGSAWLEFLGRLPMVLGDGEANWSVPYSCSDRVRHGLQFAVDGLVDLLRRRAEPAYDAERRRALLPDESLRVVLYPRRFCPRTLPDDSPLRPLIIQALLQDGSLDAGLLEGWLSRAGGGLGLYQLVNGIVAEALEQAERHPQFSGVGQLAFVGLLNSLLEAKERIKKVHLKGFSYARLERTVGMALHACFARAVRDGLFAGDSSRAERRRERERALLLASLAPAPFLSLARKQPEPDINPYGIPAAAESLLQPAYQSALERDNHPASLLQACLRAARAQHSRQGELVRLARVEALRRVVLEHLVAAEDPGSDADRLLADSFSSNQALQALCERGQVLGELSGELRRRVEAARPLQSTMPQTRRLLLLLEHLAEHPEPERQPPQRDLVMLQELCERYVLERLDDFAAAHLRAAQQRVRDQRREAGPERLRELYEAGKLYRLGHDGQPLVKVRVVNEQAQLFVDIKGYTKLTARAKELSMADFLRQEFYQPILEAAKQYRSGALLPEEQSIELVNLLGDAAAFCGNIVSLVDLAGDIQTIFRRYRQRLEQQAPLSGQQLLREATRKVEQQRATITAEVERLDGQLQALQQEIFRRSSAPAEQLVQWLRGQLRKPPAADGASREQQRQIEQRLAELAGRPPGPKQRQWLVDLACRPLLGELRRLETRRQELLEEDVNLVQALEEERHIQLGQELEAGLFISYGTAAEWIAVEDDTWGKLRVSIGERINEAARGTARNPAVRRQLLHLLEQARRSSGNPRLELPFRVYIRPVGDLEVDERTQRAWSQALRQGGPEVLRELVEAFVAQARSRLADSDAAAAVRADIYNLGEAMSGPALDAYLRERRASFSFVPVRVRPAELHPEIRERYFFEQELLNLVIGRPLEGGKRAQVFRQVGQIIFRGFERTRPTAVYEILRPHSGLLNLLEKHHLDGWFAGEAGPRLELDLEEPGPGG